MNESSVLHLPRLPAQLNTPQTAEFLGFLEHDIPILIHAKLLKPLGNPPRNGHKFFSSTELEELARNVQWLGKARRAINEHWHAKNSRRGSASFTTL